MRFLFILSLVWLAVAGIPAFLFGVYEPLVGVGVVVVLGMWPLMWHLRAAP